MAALFRMVASLLLAGDKAPRELIAPWLQPQYPHWKWRVLGGSLHAKSGLAACCRTWV